MMKKFFAGLIVLCLILSLTGCAKCISMEYESVEVIIVDKYYRGSYPIVRRVGKVRTTQIQPAVYKIIVEYDGVEYTASDEEIYKEYSDKIGYTVIGTLEVRKYDDGTTRQRIISLE